MILKATSLFDGHLMNIYMIRRITRVLFIFMLNLDLFRLTCLIRRNPSLSLSLSLSVVERGWEIGLNPHEFLKLQWL
jgi:hypothetical protein